MSKFAFSKSNLSKYVITYPHYNMSYLVTLELKKLQREIEKITGKPIKMVADNKKEHTFEIVVAGAERDGAPAVTDYDTYIISPMGNKLFVLGGRPYSSVTAVKKLIKLLKKGVTITETVTGSYAKDIAKDKKGYKLTWNDDFDGEKIDESKWEIFYGDRHCNTAGANGKKPMRCREDKPNTFVKDGSLYICAEQDDNHYYGGMLCTNDIMRFKYGYIEISTIHPKGAGFWTALWMNSSAGKNGDYFAEMNVEECYGKGGDWAYGNTFAWPTKKCREESKGRLIDSNNKVSARDERGFWQDYHTFGLEWNEKEVLFTCDGFPYVSKEINRHPAEIEALTMPCFLKLSMACGFINHGITDDPWEWENSNKYIVDYVNIYQKEGQKLYFGKGAGTTADD